MSAECRGCGRALSRAAFSKAQLKKGAEERRCAVCVADRHDDCGDGSGEQLYEAAHRAAECCVEDPDAFMQALLLASAGGVEEDRLQYLQALAEDHIASAYLDAENVVDILNATSGILVSRLRVHAIAFLLTHLGEIARAGDVPLRAAVRRMQDAGAGRAELEDLVQGAVEMLEIEDARLHELVIERAVAWGVASPARPRAPAPRRRT